VVGGAGLIGSHAVHELLKEDVAEVRISEEFSFGREENLAAAPRDPRARNSPARGVTFCMATTWARR
jgi:UDP-glucose 4-epimerase